MNKSEKTTRTPLYCLSGKVVHGKGIGKLVGMPTANMQTDFIKSLPPIGVYASMIIIDNKKYFGVTNIGKRPTVDNDDDISIETYILDFNSDIYGQTIEVQLFKFLRLPQKFQSLSILREQVFIDCQNTKKYFDILITEKTSEKDNQNEILQVGELCIDVQKRCIFIGSSIVELTTKEFDLLYLLAKNPGKAYSKEQIFEQIWNEPANGYYHAVENTICQLRKKIRNSNSKFSYIKTIVGYGYKFIDNCHESIDI